jgi:hypothetical protein
MQGAAGTFISRNVPSLEDMLPEMDKQSLRLTQKGREQVSLTPLFLFPFLNF